MWTGPIKEALARYKVTLTLVNAVSIELLLIFEVLAAFVGAANASVIGDFELPFASVSRRVLVRSQFLARTDIISVLNLTRNGPSHHRRFR